MGEIAVDEGAVEVAESDSHPEFGRIVMRLKDALVVPAEEMGSYYAGRKDEWFVPPSWPNGSYQIEIQVIANEHTFTIRKGMSSVSGRT